MLLIRCIPRFSVHRRLASSLSSTATPTVNHTSRRPLAQTTATFQTSPESTEEVRCPAYGDPDYTIIIPQTVGHQLGGQDPGSRCVKKDLVFYEGRHFGRGNADCLRSRIPLIPSQTSLQGFHA